MPAFHSLKLNELNHGGLRFLLNEVAENRQRKGMGSSRSEISSLMWFRKGLRIHDNPALEYACRNAKHVYPVFVLDPWFLDPDPNAPSPGSARVGINRIRFLLQSLADLDANLRSRGSRLILFKGNPVDVIPRLLEQWGIKRLCYEFDIEPYAQQRDTFIQDFAKNMGAEVFCPVSHTIFDPREIILKNGGKPPLTYRAFLKLVGMPSSPIGNGPLAIPSVGEKDLGSYPLPTLPDLGFDELSQKEASPFFGGETEALKRLGKILKDKKWITKFEKPKGNPADFQNPATTVLSPYLKFGCLSSRFFYCQLNEICGEVKTCTKPPVSLEGQLLWREFFYTVAYGTCNFDKMDGNPICKQIPWTENEYLLSAWRDAKTGYPWIDAIMIQLRTWGWMHHLARHSVACFLTRGDLFVHWEKGRDVFDRLLIDADWAINNGNWMWLSCSAFFSQYHRVYSPISFGKKYDPDGKFVKHFLPVLKDMPAKYVYEPWTAPIEVQKKAKCIIGKDYPEPVVCHVDASRECKKKIATAYALGKERNQEQKQAKTKFSNHANKELLKTPKKLRQI